VMPIGGKPPLTPEDMEAWEKLVPGSANKLFEEYICQLQHRRSLDKGDMFLGFFGPTLGFMVVLAFLGVSAWLISSGFGVEGTVLGSVDIATLAAVFAIGNRNNVALRSADENVSDTAATVDVNLDTPTGAVSAP
jgi:hypothetical protein